MAFFLQPGEQPANRKARLERQPKMSVFSKIVGAKNGKNVGAK
jgi:hypothetical protein